MCTATEFQKRALHFSTHGSKSKDDAVSRFRQRDIKSSINNPHLSLLLQCGDVESNPGPVGKPATRVEKTWSQIDADVSDFAVGLGAPGSPPAASLGKLDTRVAGPSTDKTKLVLTTELPECRRVDCRTRGHYHKPQPKDGAKRLAEKKKKGPQGSFTYLLCVRDDARKCPHGHFHSLPQLADTSLLGAKCGCLPGCHCNEEDRSATPIVSIAAVTAVDSHAPAVVPRPLDNPVLPEVVSKQTMGAGEKSNPSPTPSPTPEPKPVKVKVDPATLITNKRVYRFLPELDTSALRLCARVFKFCGGSFHKVNPQNTTQITETVVQMSSNIKRVYSLFGWDAVVSSDHLLVSDPLVEIGYTSIDELPVYPALATALLANPKILANKVITTDGKFIDSCYSGLLHQAFMLKDVGGCDGYELAQHSIGTFMNTIFMTHNELVRLRLALRGIVGKVPAANVLDFHNPPDLSVVVYATDCTGKPGNVVTSPSLFSALGFSKLLTGLGSSLQKVLSTSAQTTKTSWGLISPYMAQAYRITQFCMRRVITTSPSPCIALLIVAFQLNLVAMLVIEGDKRWGSKSTKPSSISSESDLPWLRQISSLRTNSALVRYNPIQRRPFALPAFSSFLSEVRLPVSNTQTELLPSSKWSVRNLARFPAWWLIVVCLLLWSGSRWPTILNTLCRKLRIISTEVPHTSSVQPILSGWQMCSQSVEIAVKGSSLLAHQTTPSLLPTGTESKSLPTSTSALVTPVIPPSYTLPYCPPSLWIRKELFSECSTSCSCLCACMTPQGHVLLTSCLCNLCTTQVPHSQHWATILPQCLSDTPSASLIFQNQRLSRQRLPLDMLLRVNGSLSKRFNSSSVLPWSTWMVTFGPCSTLVSCSDPLASAMVISLDEAQFQQGQLGLIVRSLMGCFQESHVPFLTCSEDCSTTIRATTLPVSMWLSLKCSLLEHYRHARVSPNPYGLQTLLFSGVMGCARGKSMNCTSCSAAQSTATSSPVRPVIRSWRQTMVLDPKIEDIAQLEDGFIMCDSSCAIADVA